MQKQKFVISLGGSMVVPDKINTSYLKKFKQLIKSHLKTSKFYIVVGGGRPAREYQAAARQVGVSARQSLDWVGIRATHSNAELVRSMFGIHAANRIFFEPDQVKNMSGQICVGGGWKPGWSTDYVAVKVAEILKINTVINLSNVDYVYDKDPNKFSNAKPYKQLIWAEFRKIVGNKWQPGANLPFDPMACKFAEKLGLQVVIINGNNLSRVNNFLLGKSTNGTIIS